MAELEGKPLAFAKVLLLDPQDSSLVVGTITDEKGRYIFAVIGNGRYLIKAYMLGFLPAFSSSVVIANGDQHMGDLAMVQDLRELDEVKIEVTRPLYNQNLAAKT